MCIWLSTAGLGPHWQSVIEPLLCTGVSLSNASALPSVSRGPRDPGLVTGGQSRDKLQELDQSLVNNQVTRSEQNRSRLDFMLHHQSSPLRAKYRGVPEPERELRAPPAVRGGMEDRSRQIVTLDDFSRPPSSPHTAPPSPLTLLYTRKVSQGDVGTLHSAQLL